MVGNVARDKNGTMISANVTVKNQQTIAHVKRIITGILITALASVIKIIMINNNNLDPYSIKIDEKSLKNIIFTILDNNREKPLYLIISKLNGDKYNWDKYLALVHSDENKDNPKKYEELKNISRSTNNNSKNYDEKYMKIKFSPDDVYTLELHSIIIAARFSTRAANNIYKFP